MSRTCVISLVSANLMRGTFSICSSSSTPFIAASKLVSCTTKTSRRLHSLTYSTTRFINLVCQTGPPEIQFPGEEELPSRPSKGPDSTPLDVPELPPIPEINPSENPPEFTTIPSDPPPLGPPETPSPEFPVPPSPSPPMPDTPDLPKPETPPDVVPPIWEPPGSPERSPPPGIDPPPSPMGPRII